MNQATNHHKPSSLIPGLGVIVMAAGLGKRMNSNDAKVLHQVAGKAMVLYAVDVALRLVGHRIAVVVGHQADRVRQVIESGIAGRLRAEAVNIVEQPDQLGTGHAVMQSRSVFVDEKAARPTQYLILNGDTPLLKEQTARDLVQVHQSQDATVTILTAKLDDPSGYGRLFVGGPISNMVMSPRPMCSRLSRIEMRLRQNEPPMKSMSAPMSFLETFSSMHWTN
ncbi:MAG: NTP transferase domain-containing protein [Nitrospira sp.]|nr:NTP transferase domain-containing protein [Nitrospira sp.]